MVTKPNLEYLYDAMGNRITKIVKPAGSTSLDWVYTHYVRDAQSNVIATYKKENINQSTSYQLTERHIYGSSRVGIDNKAIELIGYTAPSDDLYRHQIGRKNYELTNHLGNVNAVITDRKIPRSTNGLNIDYYMPDIVSATDYYAFGAPMPGRGFSAREYRFGFNGKENDAESNTQDYGMRIYDTRLGRFLSVDPITKQYPMLTPYQFSSNCPISGIDLDGLEFYYAPNGKLLGKYGTSTEIRIVRQDFLDAMTKKGVPFSKALSNVNSGNAKNANVTIDIFNKMSTTAYNSLEEAAAVFGIRYNAISICQRKEYSARIGGVEFENGVQVFAIGSVPTPDDANSSDIDASQLYGMKLAGGVHTHGGVEIGVGDCYLNFSGRENPDDIGSQVMGFGDMDWANKNNVPLLLANPRGNLKIYEPKGFGNYQKGDEVGKILRTDMPFDLWCGTDDPTKSRPAYPENKQMEKWKTTSDAINYEKK